MFRMAKIGRAHVKFLPIHVTDITIAQLRRSVKLGEFQALRLTRKFAFLSGVSYNETALGVSVEMGQAHHGR